MKNLIAAVTVVSLFGFVGCDESKPAGGAAKSEAAPAGAKAEAKPEAAEKFQKIENLGLKFAHAEEVSVTDMSMGGAPSYMVTDLMSGLVFTVGVVEKDDPKSLEDAKKDAEMYSPKFTKEVKTADGWNLQFENEGGMGKNYFVQVRRTIEGKQYDCSTTASSPDQASKAEKACATLIKL